MPTTTLCHAILLNVFFKLITDVDSNLFTKTGCKLSENATTLNSVRPISLCAMLCHSDKECSLFQYNERTETCKTSEWFVLNVHDCDPVKDTDDPAFVKGKFRDILCNDTRFLGADKYTCPVLGPAPFIPLFWISGVEFFSNMKLDSCAMRKSPFPLEIQRLRYYGTCGWETMLEMRPFSKYLKTYVLTLTLQICARLALVLRSMGVATCTRDQLSRQGTTWQIR